ncbi:DNA starvation/stationary phase protection protein [Dermabacteraceae bacterium TAE3-ERU27]|nr:DNA starvation/stationary phase protection protein [Dermabacteraceae bacterium TAE3-ERU27]
MSKFPYTVAGLTTEQAEQLCEALQDRLHSMNDLHLTLKHAHWNVIGRDFIAVHEMLDPQIELVRGFADELAERIATLGGVPIGVPGRLAHDRPWGDYAVDRAPTQEHLAALDKVYDGVIGSHRDAIALAGDIDPITEDLLIGEARELEQFQWFLRAHLEDSAGKIA